MVQDYKIDKIIVLVQKMNPVYLVHPVKIKDFIYLKVLRTYKTFKRHFIKVDKMEKASLQQIFFPSI